MLQCSFNINYNFILDNPRYCNCIFYSYTGNDHREAKILMSIVVVFVVCQSFTIVADTYEAVSCIHQNINICRSNDHIENIIDIAHFMLSFNSSINFLLYVIHDKIFRDAFLKVTILHKRKKPTKHLL